MKKPSWLVLLLIGVASAAAPATAPAQDLRTLTIDDMFAIQRVGPVTRIRARSAICTNGDQRPRNPLIVSSLRPSPSTHPKDLQRSVSGV